MTLTDDQAAVLFGDRVEVAAGCELLDLDLNVTSDISDDLVGGSVAWNGDARIHRSCRLDLSVELEWGAVLVRPYMTLSDRGVTERFDCGVFMLVTPEQPVGVLPVVYSAQGFDRVYLLDREVGDDYTVASGETYYDALVQVFTDAEVSGFVIDGAAADFTLPVDRDWPLVGRSTDPDQTSSPVTWLRIVNDLQTAWNGRGVWADASGQYRCQQYLEPALQTPSFTFDADDLTVDIVGEDRSIVADQWKTPNRWKFLWSNRPGGPSNVEGDGLYTVDNVSDGPTSQDARGLVWTKVYSYEAASQAVLEELGDRRVAHDRRLVTRIDATSGPFPAAGHADVFTYVDAAAGGSRKVIASGWEFDLVGSDVRWAWEAVA